MKRLIFASAVIGAGLWSHAAHAVAPAECFAKPAAVFAAHPNATHASYTLRVKRSARCWFADAFKTEVEAGTKPEPRTVAAVAQTSAPRPATSVPVPRPRTTAVALAPQPRTTAAAPAPQRRTTTFTPAPPPAAAQFPLRIPPAIQIAVNAQELSRLLPADDETPADFETRFSVSGYKVRK